jgi:hypothetical protein
MQRVCSLVILTLAVLVFVEEASARGVSPADGCPAGSAVEANLARLGVLDVLSRLGTAEIQGQGTELRIWFRDHQDKSLGVRVVDAAGDCATRAALATAVISAFAGEWAPTALAARGESGEPKRSSPGPTAASAQRRWHAELGAMAFGIHDGDVAGLGFGGRVDVGFGVGLATVLFEHSGERRQGLGTGRGAYRFTRAGVGGGVHQQWPRWFWDATLAPMLTRLSLEGVDLLRPRSTTEWQLALAAQARLGARVRWLRPFVFVGASYAVPAQQMTLADRDVKVSLSPVNFQAGLGLAVGLLP